VSGRLRARYTAECLSKLFTSLLDKETNGAFLEVLKSHGGEAQEEESSTENVSEDVKAYLKFMLVVFLIDKKNYEAAGDLSTALVNDYCTLKRPNVAPLQSQIYFYYARSHELRGSLQTVRSVLLAALQTASLRREIEMQAVLLNLILRNYLHYNLYDSADKLVSRTSMPESEVSSNQYARYVYYLGRIKAIQLKNEEARKYLQIAMRKGPQNSKALGFRVAVSKLLIIVELSMGLIPDRQLFDQSSFKVPLKPYFELTQAVRRGDVVGFNEATKQFGETFQKDNTATLVQRLHHNVIKAGLRKISVAYARITISDICQKLCLDNVEDAEFMVAKAIRDKVINATIVHDKQQGVYLQSSETVDVYSSQQPQEAFHDRIQFYLQVYNDSVRAMRFPDTHKKIVESEEERKERVKAEQELPDLMDEDEDA
jgi:26S proteasome regulatory subunit N3